MNPHSAARTTKPSRPALPFENGDHMDQKTFHQLYLKAPSGVKAELIGGIVFVASPVSRRHGKPHGRVVYWLIDYADATPGTDVDDNTTTVLGDESEPQPDAALYLLPEYGGKTTEDENGIAHGPAELVVEVASSSASIDLNRKKRDYEAAGVGEYVVVLAETRSARWFARKRERFVEQRADGQGVFHSLTFPGLRLDPTALFERSPRRLKAVLATGLASPEHAAFVAKLEAKVRRKRKPEPPAGDRR